MNRFEAQMKNIRPIKKSGMANYKNCGEQRETKNNQR